MKKTKTKKSRQVHCVKGGTHHEDFNCSACINAWFDCKILKFKAEAAK